MNTDCILQFQFTSHSLFHQGQLQQPPLHRRRDLIIGTPSATKHKCEGRTDKFPFILPFSLSLYHTPLCNGSACPDDAAGICTDLSAPCTPLKAQGGSGCPHRGSGWLRVPSQDLSAAISQRAPSMSQHKRQGDASVSCSVSPSPLQRAVISLAG